MLCNYIALPFQNWHDKILDVIDDVLFVITEETEYPNNYVFNKDVLDRIDMLITWINSDVPVAFAKQYSFCGDIRIRLDWIITHFGETIPTETVTQKQFIARLDVICDILTAGDFGVTFAPDTEWMATQNITVADDHVTFPTTRVFTVSVNPGCFHSGTSDSPFPFSCETMLRLEYIYKGLVNVIIPTSMVIDKNTTENADVGTDIVIKAYVSPSNSTIKDIDYEIENENITFSSKTSEQVGANLVYTFTFHADTNTNNEGITDITFKAVGDETVTETVEYTLIQLPTSIVLNKTATENADVGTDIVITAYVSPNNSTIKDIDYEIENENISFVSKTSEQVGANLVYTFTFHADTNANNEGITDITFKAVGDETVTETVEYTINVVADLNTIFLLRGNEISDASTYDCEITPTGTPVIDDNGKFEKAIYWDATAEFYMDVTLPKTLNGSSFTVECWVKPISLPGGTTYQTICDFCDHNVIFWELWEAGRSPCFFVGNGSSWLQTNQAWGSLSNGNWYHVALVCSGEGVKSYVNGIETKTAASNPTFANGKLRIGNIALALTRYMRGYISEFRVSDIARYTENFTPPTEPFTI